MAPEGVQPGLFKFQRLEGDSSAGTNMQHLAGEQRAGKWACNKCLYQGLSLHCTAEAAKAPLTHLQRFKTACWEEGHTLKMSIFIFRRALVFYIYFTMAWLENSFFLQEVGHLLVFCNKMFRKLRHMTINRTQLVGDGRCIRTHPSAPTLHFKSSGSP